MPLHEALLRVELGVASAIAAFVMRVVGVSVSNPGWDVVSRRSGSRDLKALKDAMYGIKVAYSPDGSDSL